MYLFKISILSLLFALPLAMLGQTSLSESTYHTENTTSFALQKRHLKKYESNGWWKLWMDGGIIRTRDRQNHRKRTGRHYMVIDHGISSLVNMDFVDGYMFGPQFVLGYVDAYDGRWEVDADIKYAEGREKWMYRTALRYVLPPEYFGSVEVFGQIFTTDFDADPLMPRRYQLLASGVFGWNGFKLYGNSSVGVRGNVALSGDFQLSAGVWYEEREQLENHKKRNVFRAEGESNVPRLRRHDAVNYAGDPLLDWKNDYLTRIQLQLDYSPGRKIVVEDDMHASARVPGPMLSLKGDAGVDGKDLHFLSLELGIAQKEVAVVDRHNWLSYYGAMGFFPVRNQVNIADMKHFDASHYLWQTRNSLTWFSLLTNYELSTSKQWAEAHGEWLSEQMFLSRLASSWLKEYLQFHFLTVQEHRYHTEFSYGIDLVKQIRMGVSVGFDGVDYDGIGFNLIWDITKK